MVPLLMNYLILLKTKIQNNNKIILISLQFFFLLFLFSCGPSSEELIMMRNEVDSSNVIYPKSEAEPSIANFEVGDINYTMNDSMIVNKTEEVDLTFFN